MRLAIHTLLFIVLFIAPFGVGLYLMDPKPDWLQFGTGDTDAPKSESNADKPSADATQGNAPSSSENQSQESTDNASKVEKTESVTLEKPTVASSKQVPLQEETGAPSQIPDVSDDANPAQREKEEDPEITQVPRPEPDPAPQLDPSPEPQPDPSPEPEPDPAPEPEPEVAVDSQTESEENPVTETAIETPPSPDSPARQLRRPIAEPSRPLKENSRYFQYTLESREEFDRLARRDNVPGALGVREIKVLIAEVDTDHPVIFYLNTGRFPYHYCFVRDLLHPGLSHSIYKNATYYKELGRKFLALSLVAHDNFENEDGSKGAYVITFWPTDPVSYNYASLAYDLVVDSMNFDYDKVYFQPAGTMQESLFEDEKDKFEAAEVPVLLTQDLYANFAFSPLNTGTSFGRLLVADASSTYSARDIVVFKTLPNDLSVAAGIITEAPQTPLSHVNLKAQQNGIPNAYVNDATTNETISSLAGEYVRYEVTNDDWQIIKATPEEVDAFVEANRPPTPPTLASNLRQTSIVPLNGLGFRDAQAVGAKAANVAELGRILQPGMAPRGFAIPFFFYDQFMKENGLYEEAQIMMNDKEFQSDAGVRRERLEAFREKIEDAEAPEWMLVKLHGMQKKFDRETPIRCRSSTNNEDLEGFNGAGLYNSYTHHPDEGHIIKSVRQVWASLWTYRAFEEREFYRVDHFNVYMGVLVHPNYEEETANGVGITRNIFDPRWLGFYVNVQVGEDLITNPDEESVPEEFLVSVMTGGPQDQAYSLEIQYARRSNKVPKGETVLTRQQAVNLARNMRTIHRHFRNLYRKQYSDEFAMDIEFKFDAKGNLIIKQARPWDWPNLPAAEDTDC